MNRVGLIFLLLFSLALPTSAEPRKLDLLAAGPAQQAESTPIRDKWALVIGISKFANPAINLRYPSKDAQDFAQFLISKQGFAPDHVKVLTDSAATRVNILTAIGGNF